MIGSASAVIVTYKRPGRLVACLEGLRSQTRPPDEVVVVVHAGDIASARAVEALAAQWRELRCACVHEHGTVAAMNRCLAEARGEIAAFVDDDAIPTPAWLERIIETFESDDRIAAVGGRDVIVMDGGTLGPPRRMIGAGPNDVGLIQWSGRMLGNHHLGFGAARDVDVLKGANMSFRVKDVVDHGFDERLMGEGAQVHSELSICLPLRRRGLRVVYDPDIVVIHHPAPRPYGYDRFETRPKEMRASVHNETLELLDYLTFPRLLVFVAWAVAVGTSASPGLAVLARDLVTGRPATFTRFRAAQAGRMAAWRTRRTVRVTPRSLARRPRDEGSRLGSVRYPDDHSPLTDF